MMNPDSFSALPNTIQRLMEERSAHSAAIATIDATLARINVALGMKASKPALPVASKALVLKGSAVKAKATPKAGKPALTANEFVLGFVKTQQNPTSKEINAAWKAADRKRTADITLSQLTKAKKLKRTPLGEGVRGSRYSIPA